MQRREERLRLEEDGIRPQCLSIPLFRYLPWATITGAHSSHPVTLQPWYPDLYYRVTG